MTEIEIYNRTDPPVVVMGSDMLNHIFGIVTDGFLGRPSANVPLDFQGAVGGKAWHASAQSDSEGIFQVEMPVGLDGAITAVAKLPNGASAQQTLQAGDLTAGLQLAR